MILLEWKINICGSYLQAVHLFICIFLTTYILINTAVRTLHGDYIKDQLIALYSLTTRQLFDDGK